MRYLAVILLGVTLLGTSAAFADPDVEHPWDATWAGGFDDGGDGVQVIVAGNDVIGLFFHGDYVEVSETEPLGADGSLSFTWDGGTGTLSGSGADRSLVIHETGAADRTIELTEDH